MSDELKTKAELKVEFVRRLLEYIESYGLKYEAGKFILANPYDGWLPPLNWNFDFAIHKDGKRIVVNGRIQSKSGGRDTFQDVVERLIDDLLHEKSEEWAKIKPNLAIMLYKLEGIRPSGLDDGTLERFMQYSARWVLPTLLKMIAAKTIASEADIRKLFAEIDGLLEKP